MSGNSRPTRIHLLGDINLLGVDDPAVPFRKITPALKSADAVFANLECNLYDPAETRSMMRDDQSGFEGFYAPPAAGEALRLAGVHVIGNANNQNYGADAIRASNQRLDELGIECRDLQTRQSSLEEIFVSLVHRPQPAAAAAGASGPPRADPRATPTAGGRSTAARGRAGTRTGTRRSTSSSPSTVCRTGTRGR